jgi:hypothetical protein
MEVKAGCPARDTCDDTAVARVLTVQVRSGRPPSDGAVVVRHSSTGRASSCGHGRAGACMMHGLLPADTEFPIHCFAERTEVSVLV